MVQGFGIRRPNRPMSYWEGELTLFCITSSSFIPRWIFVLIGHALSSDQRSDRIFPSWGRGASTHVSFPSLLYIHYSQQRLCVVMVLIFTGRGNTCCTAEILL